MLKFLKKKPSIEFKCLLAGIERVMPVTSAKDIMPKWVKTMRDDYLQARQSPDFGTYRNLHTAKCPGMFSLMREGWVVRTWQDIVIETDGNLEQFKWSTPINQKNTEMGTDYVDSHPKEMLYNYMENWPSNSMQCIIKINSPWVANIPKGYCLLELPIPYGDEDRFTTLPGIFDCDHGPAPLNQQLQWNVTNGRTLIKAGTPIAHYILVEKKKVDFSVTVRSGFSDDILTRNILVNNTFVPNYKNLSKVFS